MAILRNQYRLDSTGNYYGPSNGEKPVNVPDGAILVETDTGKKYRFDVNTSGWIPLEE